MANGALGSVYKYEIYGTIMQIKSLPSVKQFIEAYSHTKTLNTHLFIVMLYKYRALFPKFVAWSDTNVNDIPRDNKSSA